MESQHILYGIFVLSLQRIQICRNNAFTVPKSDTCLPSIASLTADISRQWEFEEHKKVEYEDLAYETLSSSFYSHLSQEPMALITKETNE